MMQRNFAVTGDVEQTSPATYPLNKETAQLLLSMTEHPGWAVFLQCIQHEADIYKDAAMNIGYSPYALEKIRFNQALALHLPRIPRAVIEAANLVLDDENSLDSIYDTLHLIGE